MAWISNFAEACGVTESYKVRYVRSVLVFGGSSATVTKVVDTTVRYGGLTYDCAKNEADRIAAEAMNTNDKFAEVRSAGASGAYELLVTTHSRTTVDPNTQTTT